MRSYFTKDKHHPEKALIELINSCHSTLDIAIYSITRKDIVNAIINSKLRGVTVRILVDKKESQAMYESKQLLLLQNSGIPIKVNTHYGLMHLKITIVDNKIISTGSYNYTDGATYDNDEVLLIIENETLAFDFKKQFNRMWDDLKHFSDWIAKTG